jgi:hypothetical protein
MSRRHQQGMLALTDDVNERENIIRRPFGGAHVLFTGDLWQLEAIGGHPVYSSKVLKGLALVMLKPCYTLNFTLLPS